MNRRPRGRVVDALSASNLPRIKTSGLPAVRLNKADGADFCCAQVACIDVAIHERTTCRAIILAVRLWRGLHANEKDLAGQRPPNRSDGVCKEIIGF